MWAAPPRGAFRLPLPPGTRPAGRAERGKCIENPGTLLEPGLPLSCWRQRHRTGTLLPGPAPLPLAPGRLDLPGALNGILHQ